MDRRTLLTNAGRGTAGLALMGGVAAFLDACGSSGSSTTSGGGSSASSGKAVNVVWTTDSIPTNIDPAIAFDSYGLQPVMNMYEGLMEYVPGGTTVRPALATSYKVSANNTKFRFNLRKGVVFHDGSKLTSADVVASFNRLQEINQGPAGLLPKIASISAPDDLTVDVTLASPNAYFIAALPWFVVVSSTALKAHKTSSDPQAKNWFASNAAGTGPYMLSSFQSGNQILLGRNAHYWRPFKAGVPTQALLNSASDESTLLELIQSGKSDFTGHLMSPTAISDAKKLSNALVISAPSYSLRLMNFPMTKSPMNKLEVRQAVQYAFDYDAYVKYYNGSATAANGPLPTHFTGWDSSIPYPKQDMAKAKQLLAKAGYPGGQGLTLSFIGVTGETYETFAGTLLQSSLQKLGVKLNVENAPWPQVYPAMEKATPAYDIAFFDTSANVPNPGLAIEQTWGTSQLGSKGGYNWSFYSDPTVDSAIAEAQTTTNAAKQQQLLSMAQKKIVETAPAIFAASTNLTQIVGKQWKNVKYDALFDWDTLRFFFVQD